MKSDNPFKLHQANYKSHPVAQSVLVAETFAFADASDFVYCAKKDLETLFGRKILLEIYTDSKSPFDVVTKCSRKQERRLIIDL